MVQVARTFWVEGALTVFFKYTTVMIKIRIAADIRKTVLDFIATSMVSADGLIISSNTYMIHTVSSTVLGMGPVLKVADMKSLPLSYYWLIVLLGILVGGAGVFFNKAILFSKAMYGKIKCPLYMKTAIP